MLISTYIVGKDAAVVRVSLPSSSVIAGIANANAPAAMNLSAGGGPWKIGITLIRSLAVCDLAMVASEGGYRLKSTRLVVVVVTYSWIGLNNAAAGTGSGNR